MTRVLKKADDGSEIYKKALADYTAKLSDANDLKENVTKRKYRKEESIARKKYIKERKLGMISLRTGV